MKVIKSEIDKSVNFVQDNMMESRYVHRPGTDYFVCYLSSHTGCNKACRFCHLTATGQTLMVDATERDLIVQALPVLEHNAKFQKLYEPELKKVHFNFMARGEPLANEYIRENCFHMSGLLHGLAMGYGLESKIKISTIMPKEMENVRLADKFGNEVELYYSLYSFDKDFRRRWLPKAMDPADALSALAQWQRDVGGRVVIHFPFIQHGNDCHGDHHNMLDYIHSIGLHTHLNVVRYNPPDDKSSESPNWLSLYELWKFEMPESKVISRVGPDVYASCGMFVS